MNTTDDYYVIDVISLMIEYVSLSCFSISINPLENQQTYLVFVLAKITNGTFCMTKFKS